MDEASVQHAERLRLLIERGAVTTHQFRAALIGVGPRDRDAFVDIALGLDVPPEDDPALPPGGVPYLPCSIEALLQALDYAEVGAADVFVDIGSGAGRTSAVTRLLTGATVVGIEIQPALARASRELMGRLKLTDFTVIEADARPIASSAPSGNVFFLYCPFGASGVETFLDGLEELARRREVRLCAVDLPLPVRPWLRRVSPEGAACDVYRSAR